MHFQHRFLVMVNTSSLKKTNYPHMGESPQHSAMHACVPPHMFECRHACLSADKHAWVPSCILGCRHACLGAAMHAWTTLCRLQSAYPSLGASMHCQIRQQVPKYAKNANHNLAQHGFKPVIQGSSGGCVIQLITVAKQQSSASLGLKLTV